MFLIGCVLIGCWGYRNADCSDSQVIINYTCSLQSEKVLVFLRFSTLVTCRRALCDLPKGCLFTTCNLRCLWPAGPWKSRGALLCYRALGWEAFWKLWKINGLTCCHVLTCWFVWLVWLLVFVVWLFDICLLMLFFFWPLGPGPWSAATATYLWALERSDLTSGKKPIRGFIMGGTEGEA